MRTTLPRAPSSLDTALGITDGGPRTKMFGFWWAVSAARVSGGTPWRVTYNTGSPDLTAHAAAGNANSGRSEIVTTTSRLGRPAASVRKRSIARAIAKGL